jgi:hypothetical protein
MLSFLLSGNSSGNTVNDHMRSTLSFDNKQPPFASQNIDYGQTIVRLMVISNFIFFLNTDKVTFLVYFLRVHFFK